MDNITINTPGIMGWMPLGKRQTCCSFWEHKGNLVIFDAGTGIAGFAETPYKEMAANCGKVFLFLSHYHLDHIFGLTYLSRFFKDREVHIPGPGKTIYGESVEDILTRLISPPFVARPFSEFLMDLHFHDLGEGTCEIEGMTVETIIQEHSSPSLGIKIDNTVCYCTDTACSDATVQFARNCPVLIHEAWFDREEYLELVAKAEANPWAAKALKAHSCTEQVVQAAVKAGVDQLSLVHLNPTYDQERLIQMVSRAKAAFPGLLSCSVSAEKP
ncbi:MAG: MBL fold metallo-hydrolase [bacterium]|nr:MBL fold metallo-hydrolase [bacterium]